MIFLGILSIGFGILMLVARDFFWALTEMGNSFAGRTSERTELWEAGQMISGVVFILIGAVGICAGVSEAQEEEALRVAPTETAVAMVALASTLDSTFAEFMPQWESSIESGVQTVRPASIGVRADALTYGRCDDGEFFVAIKGYNGHYGEDFLYLREGEPRDCDNGALRFHGSRSSNVDWQRVIIVPDRTLDLATPHRATLDAILTPSRTETATAEATERPTAAATRRPRQ